MSGFFRSVVSTHAPKKPAKLSKNGQSKTIGEIAAEAAPDLCAGASFIVNPLLSSGHSQTAYTALNKFELVDLVHYRRRVLTVDNVTYDFNGDSMPYDRWNGESTFTVDYVVQPEADATTSDSENAPKYDSLKCPFRPESQTRPLPPRTQYLDPADEKLLLDNDRPLVVALHGLSGGSYESYIRAFLAKITGPEYNFDGLVLNARGCANHTITSPQLFCGLWTNDLRYLINEHISKIWPHKKIFLIGFSLGGSITANYLGQEGSLAYKNIKGAAIMGSPWDFTQSSAALNDSFLGSKIYSPTMCQNLLKLLEVGHESQMKNDPFVKDYKSNPEKFDLKTLRDFDDAFTSKLFGFNCASEYYRHASPDQRLLNVRVPTVIVSSKDDPIVGSNAMPLSEVSLNPYTYMVRTSIGGHLGWFNLRNERWYAEPVLKLFQELATWEIEPIDPATVPHATDGVWKHDRLIY